MKKGPQSLDISGSRQGISLENESRPSIQLTLPLSRSQRDVLLAERAGAPVALSLGAQHCRLDRHNAKEAFRAQLLGRLRQQWTDPRIEGNFMQLVELLDRDGSALFGGLLDVSRFERLIARYTETLGAAGSKSFIHSYVNLANYPGFLTDGHFNDAFLHPLLIALIAYRMGGAIRMTDARGKDTQPISVLAQDNMLHVDNTPFTEEYKVILAWQKGVARGPAGQNFVYLPGTHHGTRNVLIDSVGQPWSTENASIFTTEAAIDGLFAFQHEATGLPPTVVEAQHPEQPLTIVFAAGSLVHHRYRTERGTPRSSIILAFHRASDDPGTLIAPGPKLATSLADVLMGRQDTSSTDTFLDVLSAHAGVISTKLLELASPDHAPTLVDPKGITLEGAPLASWMAAATAAASVDDIKAERGVRLSQAGVALLSADALLARLCQIMSYDKHGRLDLILYADSHEEVRKWARNRIREMRPEAIAQRIAGWLPEVAQPSAEHILALPTLHAVADALAVLATAHAEVVSVLASETMAPRQALRSIRQLVIDLGEAIVRCETLETFVATGLFLF